MSKQTLKLPAKSAIEPAKEAPEGAIHAAREITAADVMEWLRKNTLPNVATGAPLDPEAGIRQQAAHDAATFDWKYDAPVESKPFDLSQLTPANSRSISVQVPAKTWCPDKRFFTAP